MQDTKEYSLVNRMRTGGTSAETFNVVRMPNAGIGARVPLEPIDESDTSGSATGSRGGSANLPNKPTARKAPRPVTVMCSHDELLNAIKAAAGGLTLRVCSLRLHDKIPRTKN